MAYGQVNADVIGTSVSGSNLGAGNASIMKNRIINGSMTVDQRNAGASVTPTTNSYALDRWLINVSQSSKLSVQQNAGSVTPPAGFSNYLGITSLSAYSITSTDYFQIQQRIEGFNFADLGWGTANAKTVTLSFWVYSSLTGTFGGSILNSGYTRSYPFTYTISAANTWEQKSITITGDTTGTWIGATNGVGARVSINLGVGSTLSNTAGSWYAGEYDGATGATSVVGTNGATFYITGVQLEVGSSATGYEYRQYQQELALCQRYYYLHCNAVDDPIGIAVNTTASQLYSTVQFPQRMRTDPTLSAVSGTDFYAFFRNGADDLINSLTLDLVSPTTASVKNSTEVSGTAGQAGLLYCRGSFTGVVAFQAEL